MLAYLTVYLHGQVTTNYLAENFDLLNWPGVNMAVLYERKGFKFPTKLMPIYEEARIIRK